jgi:uncharacterized alkaline shock family protein YloU
MTEQRVPGRSLITRRALVDVIRPAVVGSYGVTGFAGGSLGARLLGRLGLGEPGIHVSLRDGLVVDLYLTIAYGLPVAEVARQADSAVRYALRRTVAREVDRLTIHVGGMRYQPASDGLATFPEPVGGATNVESLAGVEQAVIAAVDGGGGPA